LSEAGDSGGDPRPNARERPPDPAGTRPRHDPASLLPARPGDPAGEAVDSDAVEEPEPPASADPDADLLPERHAGAGALGAPAAPVAPFAPRFHFFFGALAAVGAAALTAILLVLVTGGGGSPPEERAWSSWRPSADGVDGARQIAARVSSAYRFTNGRQLVTVDASPMAFDGVPVSVALREDQAAGGDIRIFDDDGLIFRFCGLGPDCAIAAGAPSVKRHLLLRREALELALYSFHYLDGVDQIVVFMPPPKGEKPSQALFFRRGDVDRQLDRPLTSTLAPKAPTVRTVTRSPDITLVDRITLPQIFSFSITQANTDNRGFIVLDPLRTERSSGRP
jgi:hypothetical protein